MPTDWDMQLQEAYDTGYADGIQEARAGGAQGGGAQGDKRHMTFIESLSPKLEVLPGVDTSSGRSKKKYSPFRKK